MNATILSFWNQVINGYFRHDIQELEAIEPASPEYGLCTVPQFLIVGATLELLGKLLREGDKFEGGKVKEAWTYYFENYLSDLMDLLGPIQDLVRNGSAHLFLPKHIGVTKAPYRTEIIVLNQHNHPSLNVAAFTKRFMASLDQVEAALTNDPDLAERFAKKLNHMGEIHKKDFDKFEPAIDRYLASNPVASNMAPIDMPTTQTMTTQLPIPSSRGDRQNE